MNKKRYFEHKNARDSHSSAHRIVSISLLGEMPSFFRAGTSHLTHLARIVNDFGLFKHLTEENNFLTLLKGRNLGPFFGVKRSYALRLLNLLLKKHFHFSFLGSKGSACFIARPPEMKSLACSVGLRGVNHGG